MQSTKRHCFFLIFLAGVAAPLHLSPADLGFHGNYFAPDGLVLKKPAILCTSCGEEVYLTTALLLRKAASVFLSSFPCLPAVVDTSSLCEKCKVSKKGA